MKRLDWPQERRLLKRPQFQVCFDRGVKFFTTSFIVFAARRDQGPEGLRLGLAVSRKTGSAVARNRVKRVVREFFRLNQQRLRYPVDVVVVAKRGLDPERIDLARTTEELAPLIGRIKNCAKAGKAN
ncbi:MAG: ribonuclease P protein component [Desulfovibrionaceae bacterium]|nr:ribonuclease P protein component [Desulfovibrionaceae bacterium]MDD4951150.1 ribonuclease P protein component [Desulfovibrionaceae bacterium]